VGKNVKEIVSSTTGFGEQRTAEEQRTGSAANPSPRPPIEILVYNTCFRSLEVAPKDLAPDTQKFLAAIAMSTPSLRKGV